MGLNKNTSKKGLGRKNSCKGRIMKKTNPFQLVLLLIIFLSGLTALLYQIIWIREFGHLFGLQVHSVSAVLTSFMAGLALGSYVLGRLSDRYNPYFLFAILETGIGLFALFFHTLFGCFNDLYLSTAHNLELGGQAIYFSRFLFSFLFLIVPASLIGGTLPVIIKIAIKDLRTIGFRVGRLYTLNNLGAVIGCLLTGFVLIRSFGITQSLHLAALINLLNAVFILVLYYLTGKKMYAPLPLVAQPEERGAASMEKGGKVPPFLIKLVLWVFIIEGFTTLAYEVLWTRVMTEFSYDKSVYLSTAIIASYIFGLSLGALVTYRFLDKIRRKVRLLGLLEIGIGILSLFQLLAAKWLMPSLLATREFKVAGINPVWEYAGIFVFLLLPVVLMGVTFPLVSKIYVNNLGQVGKKIGRMGLLDTVGSILGAFVAGFVLLPAMGSQNAFLLVVVINLVIGYAVIYFNPSETAKLKHGLFIFILLLVIPALAFMPKGSDFKTKLGKIPGEELIYYNEGTCGTVSVHAYPLGYKALSINGVLFAYNTVDDLRSHRMLAYMPYFFNTAPNSVLVLGFGLGVTASTFDMPRIDSINVVEICPLVIHASAQYFSLVNDNLIQNEKLRLIIDDGRSWLQRTEEKYDVITCDAIHPRHGNNLYTKEYYEACLPKLKNGGTVCQWMPTNWLTEKEFQGLLKAFVSVFPNASLWYVNRGVSLMVGSKGEHAIDYKLLKKRMKYPAIRSDFADVDVFNPEQLLARSLMTSEQVKEYVKGVPANIDDYPYVEFGTRVSMAPSGGVLEAFIKSEMHHDEIIQDLPENSAEIFKRIKIYSQNMKGEIRNELQNIPREQAY